MTLRERIADFVDGGVRQRQVEALSGSVEQLWEAYQQGPFVNSPEDLLSSLREQYDSEMVSLLLDQLQYDVIGGLGASNVSSDRERQFSVQQGERLFRYSPLAQWTIWLWTGWGLGDRITVELEDDAGQEAWDEFWGAQRNKAILGADKIHELSDWLLVKGDRFLAYYAAAGGTKSGDVTVRTVLPSEVEEIIANPEDASETWFYKRRVSAKGGGTEAWYYPDWALFFSDDGKAVNAVWQTLLDARVVTSSDKRADRVNLSEQAGVGTVVCIQHIAHNRKDEASPWGWPITTCAAPWMRAHKQFAEARLGAALSKAQFARRSTVAGGSRGVQSVLSTIRSGLSRTSFTDTNPPGVAGAWGVQNQAMSTEELPMTTGASDAKEDNALFSWVALLGGGLFPTSAGLDTSRWATALEMDKAQSMLFEKYRTFWSEQVRTMVTIVLSFKVRYGGLSAEVAEVEAQVSVDAFSLADFPVIAKTIGAVVQQALIPLVDSGIIPKGAAAKISARLWTLNLQALNQTDAGDLTSDEAFGIGEPGEPGPETPGEETPEDVVSAAALLSTIAENLASGSITYEQALEFSIGELLEGRA
ncbi:MAG TPA: hypothetical protein VM366_02500 [Anaerolineae bacterium]|nr:hypothetical protein [Anaerolineae bacterium]